MQQFSQQHLQRKMISTLIHFQTVYLLLCVVYLILNDGDYCTCTLNALQHQIKLELLISLLKSRNWESRSRNVKEQQKITVFIIWGIVFVLWRLKLNDRPGDVTPTTCMYVWNIKKPGGKLRGGGRCG